MKDIRKVNETGVKSHFEEDGFAKEVFSQLRKEFTKIGVLIEFKEKELATFEDFNNRLTEELELIMRSSSGRIDQLLYLSDLPENKVKSTFKENKNPVKELAKMLLLRTAQKVNFKRKHKLGLL